MIKVPGEEACYHVFPSGVVDNTGRHEWQSLFNEPAEAALLAWMPIPIPTGSARYMGTTVNLTAIVCYAPTFGAAEGTHAGDMLSVAGDWNGNRAYPGHILACSWHEVH